MPFPSVTTVLDDFAGTGALSGSWTAPVEAGDSTPTRVSDVWSGLGNFCTSYWSNASFAADQELSIDATAAVTHRLYLRITGGSWYRLEIDYSYTPDQAEIRYWNGSSYTTVATSTGDIGTSEAFGFEAIGTALKGYKKVAGVWSQIVSGTDSNITGSGNAGMGGYSTTLDNFVAGDVASGQPWALRRSKNPGQRRGFGGHIGVY